MPNTPEAIGDSPNEIDWKDSLMASYQSQGFVAFRTVPQPPQRASRRLAALVGGRYDFEVEDMPWDSPADADMQFAYSSLLSELRDRFGAEHVVIAFPTEDMKQKHPEYADKPHHVVMIRSGTLW